MFTFLYRIQVIVCITYTHIPQMRQPLNPPLSTSAKPAQKPPLPPPSYAKSVPPSFLIFVVVAVIFIVIALIIVDANSKTTPTATPSGLTTGGSAVFTAPNVFIDNTALLYLSETMTELTDNCNLASPTVPLVLGSYATTTASWTSAKDDLTAVCDFYGLYSMEQRTAALEGPLDICYAYVSVGMQIVQIYYNNSLPFDFLGKLLAVYPISYPLQMYWDRSTFTSYDIATDFLNQANAYIVAVNTFNAAGGSIQAPSIQIYQMSFCNKYFGQDDLGQYNSVFQPWLAFPFEGLIQKLADSIISTPLMQLLGPIDFSPGSDFKAIYAIGPEFEGDERTQLFASALMGGIDVQVITTSPSTAVPAIKQTLYDGPTVNASRVPIFVFANFLDNVPFYNSFSVEGATMLFGFTENSNTESTQELEINLATYIQSALGARVMSAMDFATIHPYEITFGPSYVNEKFVSDLITLCIGTQVNAQSTVSGDILNTFSMKNTAVYLSPSNILDIGGRLTQEQALAAFSAQGASLGVQMPAFSIQLTESTPLGGNLTAAAEILGVAPPPPPPKKFSWRTTNPGCLPPPMSQGSCNNCWALASTRSMSSRLCIQSGGLTFNQFMSPYHVTTCSNLPQGKNGCDPQMPQTGFTFMYGDVHSQQCMPTVLTGSSADGCQQTCNLGSGGSLADVNGIAKGSYVKFDNPTDIKTSLVNDGPLAVGFSVPADLTTFFPLNTPNPNGVYQYDTSIYTIGGHMVMLTGFDDTAPVPYWEIYNTWGGTQGSGGFLKMQQDPNGMLSKSGMWFDRYAWAGTPRPRQTATSPTTILFNAAAISNPSANKPKPTVFTSQLGCPNLVVNTNQSAMQADLQGCPNSAGSLQAASTTVSTSGGHVIGGSGSVKPGWMSCILLLLLSSLIYC